MPCDSGLTREQAEIERRINVLYLYVYKTLNDPDEWERVSALELVLERARRHALPPSHDPPPDSEMDDISARLCAAVEGFNEAEANVLMYDGRNPKARRLADWWDDHKKRDAARLERDKHERAEKAGQAEYRRAYDDEMAK